MDLFSAHQLVDRRILVLTKQHQLEALLIHDPDHICTVHDAQALACVTYHMDLTLRDLTADGGDCGVKLGALLFLLQCRFRFWYSLFRVFCGSRK